jgi:hypothetical protein
MDEIYYKRVESLKKEGMKWTVASLQTGIHLWHKYKKENIEPDFVVTSRLDADHIEIWYKERHTLEMIQKITGHE